MARPYEQLIESICAIKSGSGARADRADSMQRFVDIAWGPLHATGVSWLGFYLGDGDQMVLGARQDKPACSPIGLHGVCGRAWISKQAIVVADVATLGSNYVACDPRDRSEVVVPCIDKNGSAWGVLDLDSHGVGAFDDRDVAGLTRLLIAAGLTCAS